MNEIPKLLEESWGRKKFLQMCREVATKSLADANGTTGHGLNAATCIHLLDEIDRLQTIIDTHDLCHDLHGKVGACEFAEGCAQEQRKIFGHAPHADQLKNTTRCFWLSILLNVILSFSWLFR